MDVLVPVTRIVTDLDSLGATESEKGSCGAGAFPCLTMPDTKSGREQNGKKKREQLRRRLYEQELETLDEEADLPEFEGEGDLVADEPADGR